MIMMLLPCTSPACSNLWTCCHSLNSDQKWPFFYQTSLLSSLPYPLFLFFLSPPLSTLPSLGDLLASWLSHPSPLALALTGPAHPGSFIMDQEGSPRACRPLSAPAIASLWLLANKCRISKSLLKPGGPFSANWVRVTELLSVLLRELFVSPPFADTDPHKINDF